MTTTLRPLTSLGRTTPNWRNLSLSLASQLPPRASVAARRPYIYKADKQD